MAAEMSLWASEWDIETAVIPGLQRSDEPRHEKCDVVIVVLVRRFGTAALREPDRLSSKTLPVPAISATASDLGFRRSWWP